MKDIEKGKSPANALNAFENEVLAQAGKGIDAEFAEFLIDGLAYLKTVYLK